MSRVPCIKRHLCLSLALSNPDNHVNKSANWIESGHFTSRCKITHVALAIDFLDPKHGGAVISLHGMPLFSTSIGAEDADWPKVFATSPFISPLALLIFRGCSAATFLGHMLADIGFLSMRCNIFPYFSSIYFAFGKPIFFFLKRILSPVIPGNFFPVGPAPKLIFL